MSTDKILESFTIKAKYDGEMRYTCVVLSSNNRTYEMNFATGRDVAAKNWGTLGINLNKEQMLEKAENGFGCIVTANKSLEDKKAAQSFMQNEMKRAASISDILDCLPEKCLKAYLKDYKNPSKVFDIHSEEDYIKWLKEYEKHPELYAGFELYKKSLKIKSKLANKKRELEDVQVFAKYGKNYIQDVHSDRISYSKDPRTAKVFKNIDEARKAFEDSVYKDNVTYIDAVKTLYNLERREQAQKYALKCDGKYIRKLTSAHIFWAFGINDAQKLTKTAANKKKATLERLKMGNVVIEEV